MPSSCAERCRPLLGTFVRIRVQGGASAIDAAFDEIAAVHRLMSFQEADSDVSRLNRSTGEPVSVDPRTYEVLGRAQDMAEASDGVFDITVAPRLVATGALPHPGGQPDPDADWRDIELLADGRVRLRRKLWLDLGGIAKGYAVDRAMAVLRALGVTQACVNAGGDLRVMGRERVRLAPDHCTMEEGAEVEIEDGAVASSCSARRGVHVDPRGGQRQAQFVCVAAPFCVTADALTKIVMARGACSRAVLARYGARALVLEAAFGWWQVGGGYGV